MYQSIRFTDIVKLSCSSRLGNSYRTSLTLIWLNIPHGTHIRTPGIGSYLNDFRLNLSAWYDRKHHQRNKKCSTRKDKSERWRSVSNVSSLHMQTHNIKIQDSQNNVLQQYWNLEQSGFWVLVPEAFVIFILHSFTWAQCIMHACTRQLWNSGHLSIWNSRRRYVESWKVFIIAICRNALAVVKL